MGYFVNKSLRWLQYFFLTFFLGMQSTCVLAGPLNEGTAGGNPLANPDFDFSMKNAPYWIHESRLRMTKAASDMPVDVWSLHNMESGDQQSWMRVEFFAGVPVESLEELGTYLHTKYPELNWDQYADSRMVGFKSNEILDPSDPNHVGTLGRLVYFMDRKMIVSVSWRRHPASGGNTDVTNLISSMDRYTAPPTIKSITMVPGGRVAAGARACYYIKVDDLKSSFNERSLREFKITGLPNYWIWTDLRWLESAGAFEICLNVPRSIRYRNDLIIEQLVIENERDRSIHCTLGFGFAEPQLLCRSSYNQEEQPVSVAMSLPEVDNAEPDLTPPKIESLTLDNEGGRYILRGVIREKSVVSGGWLLLKQIPGDDSEVFIAPWQIDDGKFVVDLSGQSTNGTRRVSEIIFADEHGNTSRLMVCPLEGMTCSPKNYVQCVRPREKAHEECSDTGIAIIEYFAQYRSK
jgi:hypothetical protein